MARVVTGARPRPELGGAAEAGMGCHSMGGSSMGGGTGAGGMVVIAGALSGTTSKDFGSHVSAAPWPLLQSGPPVSTRGPDCRTHGERSKPPFRLFNRGDNPHQPRCGFE